MKDGFIKAASASPVIKVADTEYNAQRVIETIKAADEMGVKMLVFPELVLTGCTCYDLTGRRKRCSKSSPQAKAWICSCSSACL